MGNQCCASKQNTTDDLMNAKGRRQTPHPGQKEKKIMKTTEDQPVKPRTKKSDIYDSSDTHEIIQNDKKDTHNSVSSIEEVKQDIDEHYTEGRKSAQPKTRGNLLGVDQYRSGSDNTAAKMIKNGTARKKNEALSEILEQSNEDAITMQPSQFGGHSNTSDSFHLNNSQFQNDLVRQSLPLSKQKDMDRRESEVFKSAQLQSKLQSDDIIANDQLKPVEEVDDPLESTGKFGKDRPQENEPIIDQEDEADDGEAKPIEGINNNLFATSDARNITPQLQQEQPEQFEVNERIDTENDLQRVDNNFNDTQRNFDLIRQTEEASEDSN